MNLTRIAKPLNVVGIVAVALAVFLGTVPMAWRVIGLLCISDAVLVAMAKSTEVLGAPGGKHLRGTFAYAFAAFAGALGLGLFVFATDLCRSLAGADVRVCS